MSEFTPSDSTPEGESERSRVRALVRGGPLGTDASLLMHLCEVAVDELSISGAVVSLMTLVESGHSQSGTIAAFCCEHDRSIEELEFGLGEGPANDAFLTSRPVLTPDLERAFERWPGYVPQALAAGLRATFAFPMLVGAARFGVFHLHSTEVRTLAQQDTATGLMLAELAMEIVLDAYSPVGDGTPPDVPLLGAERRDRIYQAQGMVMVELGVSLHEALARMRAHAFASDHLLADVAADILAGRTRLRRDREVAP